MNNSIRAALAASLSLSLAIASTAASAQAGGLSNGYLVGQWKDDRGCGGPVAMEFDTAGGVTFAGQPRVNYNVTGPDRVTMSGGSGAMDIKVQYVDQNTILLTFQGQSGPAYRCGGAAMAAPTSPVQGMFSGPAPTFGTAISPAFLTGKWKDNLLCIGKTQMRIDGAAGTISLQGGAPVGMQITGSDRVEIGGAVSLIMRYVDADTMFVDDGKGNAGEAYRC